MAPECEITCLAAGRPFAAKEAPPHREILPAAAWRALPTDEGATYDATF